MDGLDVGGIAPLEGTLQSLEQEPVRFDGDDTACTPCRQRESQFSASGTDLEERLVRPWVDRRDNALQHILVSEEALAACTLGVEVAARRGRSCHFRRIALPHVSGWLDFNWVVC